MHNDDLPPIPTVDAEIFAAFNRAARAQEAWRQAHDALENAIGSVPLEPSLRLYEQEDTPEGWDNVQVTLATANGPDQEVEQALEMVRDTSALYGKYSQADAARILSDLVNHARRIAR